MEEGQPGCCHVYRDGRKHNRRLVKVVLEVDPDPNAPGMYLWKCWLCRVWARFPTKEDAFAFSRKHVRKYQHLHTRNWTQLDPHHEN